MTKDKDVKPKFIVTSVNRTFHIKDEKGRVVLEAVAKSDGVDVTNIDLSVFHFSQIVTMPSSVQPLKRRKVPA